MNAWLQASRSSQDKPLGVLIDGPQKERNRENDPVSSLDRKVIYMKPVNKTQNILHCKTIESVKEVENRTRR